MSTLVSNIAINMKTASTWYGYVYGHTSTKYIITDYTSKIAEYTGLNLTYSGNLLVGGTLTGYTQYQWSNLAVQYEVTGLNISASTAAYYIQSNNQYELYRYALSGNDSLAGSAFSDYLIGFNGNDTLDGGAGADILNGGAGDDIYYVDNAKDVVIELKVDNTSSQEIFSMGNYNDVIVASVSYTLLASTTGIEDLMAAGISTTGADSDNAINLIGNALGQGLIGNDAANTLSGMGGDDALVGWGGVDILIGGDGNDWFFGGAGSDSMSGGNGSDLFFFNLGASSGTNLVGDVSDGYLTGDSDIADGGAGVDTLFMRGSLANYNINRTSLTQYVITTKTGNAVSSGEQITIQNIEYLRFGELSNIDSSSATALSSINIISSFNDIIRGTSGNDTLDGGAGADTLIGGAGDDIYYVDNAKDIVIELAANNTPSQEIFSMGNYNDVIVASVSYALSASTTGIEDLMAEGILTGSLVNNSMNLTGNALGQGLIGNDAANTLSGMGGDDALVGAGGADILIGGDGNDWFFGGAGNDSMSGGNGSDLFFFNFGASSGTNLVGDVGTFELTGDSDTADGGSGTDILLLEGALDNYNINRSSLTQYVITTKTGNAVSSGEQITIKNIEYLQFGDLEELSSSPLIALSSINIISSFNDIIRGTSGNDTLDGGAGADTLIGGAGDDIYYVDNAKDIVTEGVAAGIDEVRSTLAWTLSANLDNLSLLGAGNFKGTGNALSNTITGNSGNNILNGGAGDDLIYGGAGVDIINGDAGNDTLYAQDGGGSINGGAGNDILYGGSGVDRLDGGAGNDVLYSSGSGDTLIGGAGNDTYYIDNSTTLNENANGGIDTIITSINFNLQSLTNHENVTLISDYSLDAIGNALANTLTGNGANNVLDGAAGNDTLIGAGGSDTLIGGAGNDILTGGSGNDYFVFNSTPNKNTNVDTISDFSIADDTISLENSVFAGLGLSTGQLDESMFVSGAGVTGAADSFNRIAYNTTTGALYYDVDGVGGTAAVQIALIGSAEHPTLQASDLWVV